MKIKTITCHDVYNHGASLQAYALQTYLESMGHDVEIIDYKPPYLSGHYNLWAVNNPVYDKPFIKQAYILAKLPARIRSLKRKRAFDQFTQRYLKLTRRYNSYEELEANVPEADVYVAGSDQIWNTLFQNGCDKAFYLAFAPKGKIRMSYAASFATRDISVKYRPFVEEMLKSIDRVSVREKSSLTLLTILGRPDGVAVCDPVFLLNKEHWEQLASRTLLSDKPYLLTYDTEGSALLKSIAKQIAFSKNLQIFSIGVSCSSVSNRSFPYAGPLDFLQLIRDASYVVSNSFHATAFSIIFEKDFCVIHRTEDINERMNSLLADYGLSSRMAVDFRQDLLSPIHYAGVRPLIIQSKEGAIAFCKSAGI